ncbi:hypothetical protein P40_10060 [Alloalcanivorax xenomutans]|nr:hypothetical protein P40_10060 [Alloalcanivorax xenomutans]ERS06866.1 hypothetical protein Q668_21640 [Alcanivorax sp. PN-3]
MYLHLFCAYHHGVSQQQFSPTGECNAKGVGVGIRMKRVSAAQFGVFIQNPLRLPLVILKQGVPVYPRRVSCLSLVMCHVSIIPVDLMKPMRP